MSGPIPISLIIVHTQYINKLWYYSYPIGLLSSYIIRSLIKSRGSHLFVVFYVAAGKRAWQMAATQAYSYVSPKLASVSRIGKPEDVGVLNRVEIGLGKCANFKRQPHHPTNIYIYIYIYIYIVYQLYIIVHLFHLQQKFEIYGTCM